jgi:preprotein translocase subunit SecG
MNFWLFSLFTFLGSLIWNCALIGAGYSLGSNWCVVESFMDKFTWVVIVIFLLLIALYVYLKLKIKIKLKGTKNTEHRIQNTEYRIQNDDDFGAGANAKNSVTRQDQSAGTDTKNTET